MLTLAIMGNSLLNPHELFQNKIKIQYVNFDDSIPVKKKKKRRSSENLELIVISTF